MATEVDAGLAVARALRVGVYCVARGPIDAAIEALGGIAPQVRAQLACVCVLGDAAAVNTMRSTALPVDVIALAGDPGYGALQKAAFEQALRTGIEVAVILPAGTELAARVLPEMLAPFADAEVAAVVGSRLLPRATARGSMSPVRRFGNRVVSATQARLLGSAITDFHSGYRAYRCAALRDLPYRHNGDGLQFDSEILIQLLWKARKVVEVPIPQHSGGSVHGLAALRHGVQSIGTVLRARANRVYLVYHPKFDVEERTEYMFKEAATSVHQAVLRRAWTKGATVLELGAGHGRVALALHARGVSVSAVDFAKPATAFPFAYLEHDLDQPFAARVLQHTGAPVECVVALDVIEHLTRPEKGLQEIRAVLMPGGELIASTGNIAFLPLRLMLLFGQFNYGKKGILDRTHTRLFTVRSFCRTIEGEGFRVRAVRGFGPPIEDMVGRGWCWRALDRVASWLARIWPSMFSYQFLVEADVGPRVVMQAGPQR